MTQYEVVVYSHVKGGWQIYYCSKEFDSAVEAKSHALSMYHETLERRMFAVQNNLTHLKEEFFRAASFRTYSHYEGEVAIIDFGSPNCNGDVGNLVYYVNRIKEGITYIDLPPLLYAIGALELSTKQFYDRFEVTPDYRGTLGVLREELLEALTEANTLEAMTPLDSEFTDSVQTLLEECVDVLVCILGATGPIWSKPQLLKAIQYVITKNDSKTHDTHYVNELTGKITRRVK